MAYRPLKGISQEVLERELEIAQLDKMRGKTIVGTGSGDVNSTKIVQANPDKRIADIKFELSFLDPENYPPTDGTRITETRLAVSNSFP